MVCSPIKAKCFKDVDSTTEAEFKMWHLLCDLKNLPNRFPLDGNPQDPAMVYPNLEPLFKLKILWLQSNRD